MHGRLKVKTTEEQKQIQKLEKQKNIKYFQKLQNSIFECRKGGVKDESTLQLIADCVIKAPEWNLLWNYRREILISLGFEENLMNNELNLAKSCLKENPKAYAVWHHRVWVMKNHPNPNWKSELELCNYALSQDERNFHCWDYRRFLVEYGKISITDEFDYASQRICDNISNYSSWHYRCSILDNGSIQNDISQEVDLINNAIFTDPHDQSPWFYLRWLMLYNKRKSFIREMYINKKLKQVILIISEPVTQTFMDDINIEIRNKIKNEDNIIVDSMNSDKRKIEWKGVLKNSSMSAVWTLSLIDDIIDFDEHVNIVLTYNKLPDFKWECDLNSHQSESLIRTDTDINRILCDNVSEEVPLEIVREELETIRDLYSLEGNNKWILLTIITMLRILSPIESKTEILEKLTTLKEIDPLRKRFYDDACSKLESECELIHLYHSHKRCVDLFNRNLTMIAHLDWMTLMTSIDLSSNNLTEIPSEFQYLLCVEILNLSDNRISSSLEPLRGLPSLQRLLVPNNQITEFEMIEPVLYCPLLNHLNIKGNLVSQLDDLTERMLSHPTSKNQSSSISLIYDRSV